jgi:PAS domain S-box-containing protein
MAQDVDTALSFIHPDDMDAVREAHRRLEETGEGILEYRQRTKTGDYRWISNHLSLTKDNDGKPLFRSGNLSDITMQKNLFETLRESEARFRTIAEALPALISLSRTEDSTIVYTNKAYNDAFGFKREEIVGRKGPDVYYDEADRKKMLEAIEKQGFVDGYQLKAKKTDGSPLWLSSSVRPIIYEGKPAILGASIDITERKKAEADLLAANRELAVFNQAMVGREVRMVELKKEINTLLKELGRSSVYDTGSTAG